jgi:hypothetical protein
MDIHVPYHRFLVFPDSASAKAAWHRLHELTKHLKAGTYTILPHHWHGDITTLEVIGETPSKTLAQSFKKAWAQGNVKTRVAPRVRYHSLVEHVKTKRDNGWLPISHTAYIWMNDFTAPFVRVEDSPGV